ncbi:uncharacterized protein PHALS_11539 [Plasmopara halstedii]|uniref:Uncharacterized protein n=1 Tax=Plasmopara halstedii TaxID=4781 RepID=A0A0P1A5Y4_PLAHL|nr:uncharacterized protein PHALS_11539 [Plasmopara halstedii]CEG35671.1 hypothetical protein PHALS_11539 [Plasmopara halstedii]|eukprot:XP_024572040.1 hypothetical protein PHALS_11539 [Plasmopara halstedii]
MKAITSIPLLPKLTSSNMAMNLAENFLKSTKVNEESIATLFTLLSIEATNLKLFSSQEFRRLIEAVEKVFGQHNAEVDKAIFDVLSTRLSTKALIQQLCEVDEASQAIRLRLKALLIHKILDGTSDIDKLHL